MVRPRSTPLISAVHTYAGIRHVWNTFSDDQIDLDFSNPDVLEAFVDILFFYIRQGAGIIRLDAIAFLWKRLGTSCMSLPEDARGGEGSAAAHRSRRDPGCAHHRDQRAARGERQLLRRRATKRTWCISSASRRCCSTATCFGDASYLTTWAARLSPPPDGHHLPQLHRLPRRHRAAPAGGSDTGENVNRLLSACTIAAASSPAGCGRRVIGSGPTRSTLPCSVPLRSVPARLPGGAHAAAQSFQGMPALYIHSLLATTNDLDLVEQTGRTRSINRGHWQTG